MNKLSGLGVQLLTFFAVGCNPTAGRKNITVLLGVTKNVNTKCIGHTSGLCGPEDIATEVAGVFATEPECQGLKLRGLTEQERSTPSNRLPFLFELFYEGTPHAETYSGTGKGEGEGFLLSFNGPKGQFP
jgi:hypothetical protein